MKKSVKIACLSILLLFGIVLKVALLFYMSKQIHYSEYYIYHEWLNFALDSVAVFAGFYFLIQKVNKTWLQAIFAVLASAYTYVCVMAEKLMFIYQFYCKWGGYESDIVSIEYHGMKAELLDTVTSCTLFYVRTFVLLTAILCAFAIILSKKAGEDTVLSTSSCNRFVWTLLAIFLVIDCYLKAIAHFTAGSYNDEPLYWIFGRMGSSEHLNYVFDIAIFLLLFAVLNTRIKKLVWKIVSIVVLSLFTIGLVMLENIVFLYRSDWCWYNYGDMTETKYILRYFSSAFKTVRPKYVLVALGFSLACVVILICNMPAIKNKLVTAWNFVRKWFVSETDEKERTLTLINEDGDEVPVTIFRFSSIYIKNDGVEETVVVSKDANIENRFYVYNVDEENYVLGDILTFDNPKEMYEAYANRIISTSNFLYAGDE